MLAVGDSMPRISVPDDTGATIDTASLIGRTVVFWFYPKDDTPG